MNYKYNFFIDRLWEYTGILKAVYLLQLVPPLVVEHAPTQPTNTTPISMYTPTRPTMEGEPSSPQWSVKALLGLKWEAQQEGHGLNTNNNNPGPQRPVKDNHLVTLAPMPLLLMYIYLAIDTIPHTTTTW